MADAPHRLVKGSNVWVQRSDGEWQSAVVKSIGDEYYVAFADGSEAMVPAARLAPAALESSLELHDMTHAKYLNEPSMLNCLQERFVDDQIYTMAGPVLIAMNPFKQLSLYTPEWADRYIGNRIGAKAGGAPPHIYQVAAAAFKAMVREGRSQSLVVSGESGAGKTETTKKALQLFTSLAGGGGIEERVLETNPILEAFGNAKTLRNNNSSRFGKLLVVHFSAAHKIAGASIKTYLLEKSRVVTQLPGERSYHVFYQLVAGASDEERVAYNLPADAVDFKYLNKSGCTRIAGVDDCAEFDDLRIAMTNVGIDQGAQWAVFALVAAVLWLGNIEFKAGDNDSAVLKPGKALHNAARLLQVDPVALEQALLTKRLLIGRDVTLTNNRLPQAEEARDALAKSLYAGLFSWLVKQVNDKLAAGKRGTGPSIAVLDIFGFEKFENNSFEQLCINTTNERLQQTFNRHVFELQMAEYRQEGVADVDIAFQDNSKTVELIGRHRAKTQSIFSLLEDACKTAQGKDRAYFDSLKQCFAKQAGLAFPPAKPGKFALQHYAGEVLYNTDGFIDKNKDTLNNDLVELMQASSMELVQELGDELAAAAAPAAGGSRMSRPVATVSSRFNSQLEELMLGLEGTGLHFVRCIKPNEGQQANAFQQAMVLQQLRCCGVLEVIRLAQAGYPSRCLLDQFAQRYVVPDLPDMDPQRVGESAAQACRRLLAAYGVAQDQYVFGSTKVFFRAGALGRVEDSWGAKQRLVGLVRSSAVYWRWRTWLARQRAAAAAIQGAWLAVRARRRLQELRLEAAVVKMQRLFRQQLHRRRQWQRFTDAVHKMVAGVQQTRAAFVKAQEAQAAAAAAAEAQAKETARRAQAAREAALQELGGDFGLADASAIREALSFWRDHQSSPAKVRSLEVQLLAAHEEALLLQQQLADGAARSSAELAQQQQLEAVSAQLAEQRNARVLLEDHVATLESRLEAERQQHKAALAQKEEEQEQVVAAMRESQAAEASVQLAALQAELEQQRLSEVHAMAAELNAANAALDAARARGDDADRLRRQVSELQPAVAEAAQLRQQVQQMQAYIQSLADRFGSAPSFPPPPAGCNVRLPARVALAPARAMVSRDSIPVAGGDQQGRQLQTHYSFIAADSVASEDGRPKLGRSKALFENRNVRFVQSDAARQRAAAAEAAAADAAASPFASSPFASRPSADQSSVAPWGADDAGSSASSAATETPPPWGSSYAPPLPPVNSSGSNYDPASSPFGPFGGPPVAPLPHVARGSNRKCAWRSQKPAVAGHAAF